jgi:hypothetical protein
MACTTCLVCPVITASSCCKNTLGRASASSGHITKFEDSTLCVCGCVCGGGGGCNCLIIKLPQRLVKTIDIILKNKLINGTCLSG